MNNKRPGGAVIETNWRTERGKSRGWRLAPGYRDTCRVVCNDVRLNAKIARLQMARDRNLLPVHHRLCGCFAQLNFDLLRARRIVDGLVPDDTDTITIDEYRRLLHAQCDRLTNDEPWLTVDPYGRVHTAITSLPKELRCCLSVDGEPLVGFDLCNSQPLMLGLLARRWCRSQDARYRIKHATFAEGRDPYRNTRGGDGYDDHVGVTPDVRRLVEVCAEGNFYESLGDRETVKKGMLTIMMGPNKYRSALKDEFTTRYPTVATMLSAVKEKEHARAAWLLQNLESRIIIGGACGRLMQAHTHDASFSVFTIHDSLFTVAKHVDECQEAVYAEFAKYGVVPKLKVISTTP